MMQKRDGTRREKRQWVSRFLGVCVSFLEFMIVGRVGEGVGEYERRERERERSCTGSYLLPTSSIRGYRRLRSVKWNYSSHASF